MKKKIKNNERKSSKYEMESQNKIFIMRRKISNHGIKDNKFENINMKQKNKDKTPFEKWRDTEEENGSKVHLF